MAIFLSKIIDQLLAEGLDMKDVALVTPGRRAALFIRRELSQKLARNTFSPEFYTIEDLTARIARIEPIDQTGLLFEFYGVYRDTVGEKSAESFDVFARWGETLLGDFNEIDRYRLAPKAIFDNLQAIEQIENWDPSAELSPMMHEYKNFWHLAEKLYHALRKRLLSLGKGYQGMIFRRAAENIHLSAAVFSSDVKWVFIGFNALNECEKEVMQWFVKNKNARLYYDCDSYYMDDHKHEAGIFLRRLKSDPILGKNFSWSERNLQERKKLRIIGIPKQVGQAKAAASVLEGLIQSAESLEKTALVLADEQLLIPTLSSLPKSLPCVNVTMGYPLSGLSASGFVDCIISLHNGAAKLSLNGFYHKDVLNLLSQSVSVSFLSVDGINYASILSQHIRRRDIVVFDSSKYPKSLPQEAINRLDLLLGSLIKDPLLLCERIIETIQTITTEDQTLDDLSREYFFKLSAVLDSLYEYMRIYPYIDKISTLSSFFHRMCSSEKLSFYGEPLEGLQLMGILETRLLDFENVIISSLNEGCLPAGRSDNSFIPYDVKRHFELPTYKEKDAIYAYHFYRLIQRAKNIFLIYNSDQGSLGQGEASRFLSQLRYEFADMWDVEDLSAQLAPSAAQEQNVSVDKTAFAITKIRELLTKGLSPSTLNSYLKNPMEFYYRKILGINEAEEVEETLEANSMGTVIHTALEKLYTPFIGRVISIDELKNALKISDSVTKEVFAEQMGDKNFSSGKNFLIFEATKQIVRNFVKYELSLLEKGHSIEILALEQKLERVMDFSSLDLPVKLVGTIDRIDRLDGELRILDYKSGVVQSSDTSLTSFDDLFSSDSEKEFTKEKALQLMFYALLYCDDHDIESFLSGIISTRKPSDGVIKLGFYTGVGYQKQTLLSSGVIDGFVVKLEELIAEMLDQDKPFVEGPKIYYDI